MFFSACTADGSTRFCDCAAGAGAAAALEAGAEEAAGAADAEEDGGGLLVLHAARKAAAQRAVLSFVNFIDWTPEMPKPAEVGELNRHVRACPDPPVGCLPWFNSISTSMASSLLLLLDDIATVLDDVSVLAKVAAKKTAGVLGDDLALNAQQVSGVKADRELPVVWAVAKGSFVNKAILVPAALAISAFAPWAVTPLLMIGGAFLCYEGFEKIVHKLLRSHRADDNRHQRALARAVTDPSVD